MGEFRIYNTMSHQLEDFIPGGVRKNSLHEYPAVTIYSCGPTVYNHAHIGNFRAYMFSDLLRRYLKYRGYKVNHAMNITDVDDKTIAGSIKEGIPLSEYTERYTKIFFDDLATLNIEAVEHNPRATDSIDAMDDIINKLDAKGLVYEQQGSLYFSIAKFPQYGKLSRLDTREIKSGARYDADEYKKDDARDFALWKATTEKEPSWTIKRGTGRPGWHIECSAMIRKIFGGTIDIHTGGVDLIFPHHENEIAQSEAAYNEKFVRYWLHLEHLLVEGTKMSKSLGNFYTLEDLLNKGYSPRAIRHLLMSAHYRKQLNFTLDGLKASAVALDKIDNFIHRVKAVSGEGPVSEKIISASKNLREAFLAVMDNDLNISGATGSLFEYIREMNVCADTGEVSRTGAEHILETLSDLDRVFGFIFFPAPEKADPDAARFDQMVIDRKNAKASKNFAEADRIRDALLAEGIILEDGKDGTRWKRKK
jgi:cysteinyl-tRNA synthetase